MKNFKLLFIIVAFLKNGTIEYSLESLCASVCVCLCVCFLVCVFLHNNSKRNRARNMKFKYFVVNENNSDKIDIGHCGTMVKVTVRL